VRRVIALGRVLGAVDDPVERARLHSIIRELRGEIGVGVPKKCAADVLGVSVQALDRWTSKGRLPVVRRPQSSRELIDAGALIALAERVERLREEGQPHGVLARALSDLERTGRMPRRLRPNMTATELRRTFLATSPVERLREAVALSHDVHLLASRGQATRADTRARRVTAR
jgi:hypothetical protein